jgi:hypothetical protein
LNTNRKRWSNYRMATLTSDTLVSNAACITAVLLAALPSYAGCYKI